MSLKCPTDLVHFQQAFVFKKPTVGGSNSGCPSPTPDESRCSSRTRSSSDSAAATPALQHNERLEYLGDGILTATVGAYLFERFPYEQEGFLTKMRTRIVCSSALCQFARYLQLARFIELPNGYSSSRIQEDAFEAFVGAIIATWGMEEGFRYARRFIINIIENLVDFSYLIQNNNNHKDILQRFFQSRRWHNPKYVEVESEYCMMFVRLVLVDAQFRDQLPQNVLSYDQQIRRDFKINAHSKQVIVGMGKSGKKITAEQRASKIALVNFNIPRHF
ncbi:ribonuclease III domain-containing protein [Polychytrium aggregatum]|uniref:ribonuclease III domain-containing protein n=1 Tax=Polychytrium aggregatum TaxID=110093 RepID=UPI0022FDE467|nr:ribonuclease III domain-containing protein [Polychytrium aggregatum]XP_052961925.1 ribonuclease III domain-containing protein [Polychytrium aggregatum]KAI9190620.1 ribonuclease III domain-containing protein [Polychytrium aggregatum]KAI9192987.1 ribonuclease III domain-containing protein [Polychytrium aggregatum]